MATSANRRNRRRRKAGALVAVGASAALLGGTLSAPAPAEAALLPLTIGSLGEAVESIPIVGKLGVLESCDAGDTAGHGGGLLGTSADCSASSKWVLGSIGDALLGLVAPDIAQFISVAGLNGALATPGPEGSFTLIPPNASLHIPGSAQISGSGYTTAITLLGGESSAHADYILAGAMAVAATGGIAAADSLFGLSIASAVGRPATSAGLIPAWSVGSPRVKNSATAKSLPFGVAIANSSLTLGELLAGAIQNVPQHRASTVALGGITTAYRSVDGATGAVCTAAYGEARVHTEKLDNDGNVSSSHRTNSCTSILFIFQKQQNDGKHGGHVVYAIKNPLDVGLVSPFGDDIAELISDIGGGVIDLGPLNDILAGKFVPELQGDIVRIVMTPDGPKLGSDLGAFFNRIFSGEGLGGLTDGLGNLFNGLGDLSNPTALSAEPAARSAKLPLTLASIGVDAETAPSMSKAASSSSAQVSTSEAESAEKVDPSTPEAGTGTDQGQVTETVKADALKQPLDVVSTETPLTTDPESTITQTPSASSSSEQGSETTNSASEALNPDTESGSPKATESELASVG